MRNDLIAFAQTADASLTAFPTLEVSAARFRFIAVAERWIEARHSLLKHDLAIAPNHGVAHIVFCGLQVPLRHRLSSPEYITDLADAFERSKNAWECIVSCGLTLHPAVRALQDRVVRPADLLRKCSAKLRLILYHADGMTLHCPLGEPVVPDDALDDDSDNDGHDGGDDGGDGGGGAGPCIVGHDSYGGPSGSNGGGQPAEPGPSPPPPKPPPLPPPPPRSAGSSGCALHDSLWCKAALAHLKVLEKVRKAPE